MSVFNAILASFYPQRAIGPFEGYVTFEEVGLDRIEITRHPVQNSFTTDNAIILPPRVVIELAFNQSLFPQLLPLSVVYENIIELQTSFIPFKLVTGKRSYDNMLIAGVTQKTDIFTENILSLRLELEQIIIVSVQTVTVNVAARSNQANAGSTGATEQAGQKQTATVPPAQSSSIASDLGTFLGF